MDLSYGDEDEFGKIESEVPLIIAESGETRQKGEGYMDVQKHHNAVEFDVQFWPVEHPMEPQGEDRPVKCPIPTSSVMKDGRMKEETFAERLPKRAELPAVMNKQGIVMVAEEPPLQAVRKRHHTLTRGDSVISPSLTRMPSLPSPSPSQKNATIFQMLQQLDKFDY